MSALKTLIRAVHGLMLAAPLVLVVSCGGSGGSGSGSPGSGTNVPTAATTTDPDLEGTVSGTTRVVANKSYTYSATAATGMVGAYTVNWGDGAAPFSLAASSATQDKIWRSAGNYTASLARTKTDGTVVTGTQSVAVVDRPVSTGLKHSCAIMSDNTVSCWGDNSKGQLGIGTLVNTNAPTAVTGLSNVVSLVAFGNSTCAALTDGNVWCWGYGLNATTGLAESVTAPLQKAGVTDVVALAGGNIHACALQRVGTVICWGSNLQGEMGAGPLNDPTNVGINPKTPQVVVNMSDAVSIAAGGYTTCAIRADSSVWCWGGGVAGQAGPGVHNPSPSSTHISFPVQVPGVSNAVSLAINYTSSCAVLADRSVKCWGSNTGVTGFAQTDTPVTVASVSNAAAMSLGYSHACVLKTDASVACWGAYSYAGAPALQSAPVAIMAAGNVPLTNVLAISSGLDHSCALKEDGSVFCWGLDDKGQLGDGLNVDRATAAPVLAAAVGAAFTQAASQSIAAGGLHTCVVKINGQTACWGDNRDGQAGSGMANSVAAGATAISANGWNTCAIKTDGRVACWGDGSSGHLGNGANSSSAVPVDVSLASGVTAKAISVGWYFTCAIQSNDDPLCWGYGEAGGLGNGLTLSSNTPVPVALSGGVSAVATGGNHACAIKKSGGTVVCWGLGQEGQLGNATNTWSIVPVAVNLAGGVTGISSGRAHSCAIKADGHVVCWGWGTDGQVGNGVFGDVNEPVAVSITGGVSAISAGVQHTCAIRRTDREVVCWGWGGLGQMGNGTNASSNVPVSVNSMGGVVAISAGYAHTCALKTNGDVMCWGWGTSGQLGNSSYASSNVPVSVLGITLLSAPVRTFWR